MDLYLGRQLAPGIVQNHDFNPGVAPSGLFWTIAVPPEAVTADPVAGTATYTLTDVALGEYFHLGPGINNGPNIPAKASFTITWTPGPNPKTLHVTNPTQGFQGDFIQGIATASWSASEDGFTFTSAPPETSKTVQAEVGTERNGKFLK